MAIRGSGIEHVFIETRNWGATVAFWKRFGYEVEFETDHHSGSLAHPRGGPKLFVSERQGETITEHLCLGIDNADEASLDGLDVAKPWTPEHWDVMEAIVRDPDGRSVSLQAPLPEHAAVEHHDLYWLGARPTLAVADVGAVVAVFVDALGWNVFTTMGDPVDFALIGAARASLALARSDAPPVTDLASVYVDVDGVDAVYARCVAHGLEVSNPLTEHPWGQRDFCVRLPSGHQVAFGERVG